MFFQLLIGYTLTNIFIIVVCTSIIALLPLLKGEIPVLDRKDLLKKFLTGVPISMFLFLFVNEIDLSRQIISNNKTNQELKEKLIEKRNEGNISNLDLFKIVYKYDKK